MNYKEVIRKHKKLITLVGIGLLGVLLIVGVVFGVKYFSKDKKDENPSTSAAPTPEVKNNNVKKKINTEQMFALVSADKFLKTLDKTDISNKEIENNSKEILYVFNNLPFFQNNKILEIDKIQSHIDEQQTKCNSFSNGKKKLAERLEVVKTLTKEDFTTLKNALEELYTIHLLLDQNTLIQDLQKIIQDYQKETERILTIKPEQLSQLDEAKAVKGLLAGNYVKKIKTILQTSAQQITNLKLVIENYEDLKKLVNEEIKPTKEPYKLEEITKQTKRLKAFLEKYLGFKIQTNDSVVFLIFNLKQPKPLLQEKDFRKACALALERDKLVEEEKTTNLYPSFPFASYNLDHDMSNDKINSEEPVDKNKAFQLFNSAYEKTRTHPDEIVQLNFFVSKENFQKALILKHNLENIFNQKGAKINFNVQINDNEKEQERDMFITPIIIDNKNHHFYDYFIRMFDESGIKENTDIQINFKQLKDFLEKEYPNPSDSNTPEWCKKLFQGYSDDVLSSLQYDSWDNEGIWQGKISNLECLLMEFKEMFQTLETKKEQLQASLGNLKDAFESLILKENPIIPLIKATNIRKQITNVSMSRRPGNNNK
ncbi:hypothetical protein [Candidatus Phytoplasma pruni]|uniref:Uncharacterized protein n=1 Tax=Candidatus Phytoplasma pruni TaxID=479893 RepID=A0A851HJM3_9MOLU|nr:hypothetical protein [Candidatus Phytoplasma pruni]NWN45639.1 hypothetical protein [Candidatus Phytoplasma pruni]